MFIIHTNKTHIYIFNEVFFNIVCLFWPNNRLDAADDKSKEIKMPETFISGDATKGSQLVESCAACHGADGNSISTDWPNLMVKIKDICMSN